MTVLTLRCTGGAFYLESFKLFKTTFTINKLELLSSKQRQLLITIMDLWNKKTKASEFTIVSLGKKYNQTPQSIRMHINTLIEIGFLRKTPARYTYELPFMTKNDLESQLIRKQLIHDSWTQKHQL